VVSDCMFIGRLSISLTLIFGAGIFSSGCLSKKRGEVAEAVVAPPASYPTGPAGYGSVAVAPVPEYVSAASPVPAIPAPFELGANEELVTHLIVSGESLSSIAGSYNSSISRIMSANAMSDTLIYAGKPIQVPVEKTPRVSITNGQGPATSMTPNGSPASAPLGQAPSAPDKPSRTVDPASTSYPRQTVPVAPVRAFPTPSF